jgi:hypothetical protein
MYRRIMPAKHSSALGAQPFGRSGNNKPVPFAQIWLAYLQDIAIIVATWLFSSIGGR